MQPPSTNSSVNESTLTHGHNAYSSIKNNIQNSSVNSTVFKGRPGHFHKNLVLQYIWEGVEMCNKQEETEAI